MFEKMFEKSLKIEKRSAMVKLLYRRIGESHLHCCKPRSYYLSPEQTSGLIGFLNIFRQTSGLNMSILFLMPPMLQTSDSDRSNQNYHFKSDNYILIPRTPMPED